MKKGKRFVQVAIPEGKKAMWNEQGLLQFVDKEQAEAEEVKPKDITERLKTLYDAQKELESRADKGDDKARQLIEEYNAVDTSKASIDLVTYLQLRIITSALNEGWEPELKEDEQKWRPYFIPWTQDGLYNISDEEKDTIMLLLWGGSAIHGSYCGFSYWDAGWTYADANIGSRLVYKTKALATYAGRQFVDVYARFFIGERAKGAKPWRGFEEAARR